MVLGSAPPSGEIRQQLVVRAHVPLMFVTFFVGGRFFFVS
jgi:hypothetical protein